VVDKVKSILKPTHARDGRIITPISATTSAKGVYSSKECFTTPPVPIAKAIEEPEPELYNYNGQVVTRSAMELLEKEDLLAAKGGLFERDGVVMTASALSLLQAQEALDRADSAGQGEYGRERVLFVCDTVCANLMTSMQRTHGMLYGKPPDLLSCGSIGLTM
jgi:hypothetical protein